MRLLFLIGNGFDLSLGLPTDYKSWSDLEKAIGDLAIFEEENDYLEAIRDLRNNLKQ